MNLENKTKPYEIKLKDYIPIYGWFRYQIKSFKAGLEDARKGGGLKERLKSSNYFGLRSGWLTVYNVGCIYSFILWDRVLNLGIVDKMQKLIEGEQ